ncbi:MAG TPA: VWA domain-containing protein [Anaeromyxobacteraceae bacterium]|nr:VWA domain-containing protein [Anaeromyxobacteraceae bacterium]
MKTNARLTFEKIRFDAQRDVHLLVELRAPAVEWQARRPAICVIPVIDVSGSMSGAKLHYAKQSVMKLVDHLAPGDLCGLVTFTDDVVTIAPPLEMTQAKKASLKAAVGDLGPRGSTNFAGGLLEGLRRANEARVPPGMVRRVIMFTDGLANVGPATAHADILRLLEANLGAASVSAFGYGEDADQELLRDLSTKGKGNYAFVRNPEDALTAFARELGGLLSTYARDIALTIRPAPGVELLDVVSDVDSRPGGEGVRIALSDILSEELREIVVGLRLGARPAPGTMPVALVEGTYRTVDGESGRSRDERFELQVVVERVPAGEEQLTPTRDVDQAVATAQLVRVQIHAEEAARRGDFPAAQALLTIVHDSLTARGHDVVADACARVMAGLQDRDAFAASAPFRSSLRKGMSRGAAAGVYEEDAAAFTRRTGKGTVTLCQAALERSFKQERGDDEPGKPPRGGRSPRQRPPAAATRGPRASSPPEPGSSPQPDTSLNRRRSRRW